MSHFTRPEVLAQLQDLTQDQLDHYIQSGVVVPVQSEAGPLFRALDIARLDLIIELSEGYHLDDEALSMVMSLIDQLHGLRGDMRAMLDAIAQEPGEIRARLRVAIRETRGNPR